MFPKCVLQMLDQFDVPEQSWEAQRHRGVPSQRREGSQSSDPGSPGEPIREKHECLPKTECRVSCLQKKFGIKEAAARQLWEGNAIKDFVNQEALVVACTSSPVPTPDG